MADRKSRRASEARPKAPEGEALALKCVEWAHDRKALDPVVIDLRGRSPFTDFFVVVSGRSDRQVKAIVESVVQGMKAAKVPIIGTEGESRAQWVLIDASDVVVHVFYAPQRSVYDLESLWSDAPRLTLPELPEEPGSLGAADADADEAGRAP